MCATGLFLFCFFYFVLLCFAGIFSWVEEAGMVTYGLKRFQGQHSQPDDLRDFTPCPFCLSRLLSYQHPFIYYSWAIFVSPQIPNPRTSVSPVPLCKIFSRFLWPQSKCDLATEEASSDHLFSAQGLPSAHCCPSYYPDWFYSQHVLLSDIILAMHLVSCLRLIFTQEDVSSMGRASFDSYCGISGLYNSVCP